MEKRSGLAALKRIFAIVLCAAVAVTYVPFIGTGNSKAYALDPENGDSIAFNPVSSDYILDKDMWGGMEDDETYTYCLGFRDGDEFTVTEDGNDILYTYSGGMFYDEEDNSVYVDYPQYTGPDIEPGNCEFTIVYEGARCTFEVNVLPNPINEIKYEPAKDEYTDAEIAAYRNKDEDGGWLYTLPYRNGDKLTIDWADEQIADTVYTYNNNVFVDGDNQEIDSDILGELTYYCGDDEVITGRNDPYDFNAQYDGKTFYAYIQVIDSSVTSVIYNPAVKERTDRDMMNYRDDGDGLYAYSLPFEIGDTITVNQNSGNKTYTFKENAIRYEDDGEVYYVDGFVDANNNPLNDEDVVSPYYESEEEIVAGRSYEFEVMYKGVKAKTSIRIIPSPIDGISFEPSKKAYSEADLIAYEDFYPARDDEDTDEYYYYLEFNAGDKLVIDWNDSEKEDTTFVYTEKAIIHKEGSETYYEDGFVDEAKIEEPIDFNDISGLSCESDHRLTAADSPCEFSVEYKRIPAYFNLEITKSGEEEKALAEAKKQARKIWDEIDEKYDIAGKLERREYRPAQEQEIYQAWHIIDQAIENAKSKADLDKAVAEYEATVKAVKTDAQMKADEKAKADAKKAADELKEWNGTVSKAVPAVKSAKFKAAKKKVTVSWKKATKKNLKKFDKVEIQVCKDKKFQKANTTRVEVKKSKKSATVKKLKKGTYYVRVRNVKGFGVNKQVSKWSKVKKVKVK